jgi:hypothetical protein
VPLIDSRVRAFYRLKWASDIRKELRDDIQQNRTWLEDLASDYPVHGNQMPLTRVADVLVWMSQQ